MKDDLYERLMQARALLWEAAMEIRHLRRESEPQVKVDSSDVVDMAEVHRLMELP